VAVVGRCSWLARYDTVCTIVEVCNGLRRRPGLSGWWWVHVTSRVDCRIRRWLQSSSATSSPYVSSSFASSPLLAPIALSSSIFCVKNMLRSLCRVLSDDWSSARYATRSCVGDAEGRAGSDEEKTSGDEGETVGDV
jgi:hypothetical protein